jgi:transposase
MEHSPPLENIWEISGDLWEQIEPVLLEADPPKATGRKRVDQRRLLNGVIYKMRTGCQWNNLPKELGDDSTIHRAFQRWVRLGVFARVWAMVEESQGVAGPTGTGNGSAAPSAKPKTGQQGAVASQPRRTS